MGRKSGEITAEAAMRKATRQILTVVAVGLVLIAADIIASIDSGIEVRNSEGRLTLIRPEAGEDSGYLTLTAKIEGEAGTYEETLNVMVQPYEDKAEGEENNEEQKTDDETTTEEKMAADLRSIADGINADSSLKKVSLPSELETGEKIIWTADGRPKTNTVAIVILIMLLTGVLYKERFSELRKQEEANRESVLRQLPGFINRIVLLLNAGMVLSSAFGRAVEESTKSSDTKDDYFYDNLRKIYVSMNSANGSMNKEFMLFAKRSGVKELMRVSNIINDNVSKGTALTHKLKSEGDMLWLARKKRCEELGRLAETKLTLPLVIFLVVLIVITIAPALLEL